MDVKTIAVIGAGTMGRGIAYAAAFGGYKTIGKNHFYVQALENKCEARMKCAVFAYTINARGAAHGRSTLILGAKSEGAAATKSYALKVKGMGGFGTADRECRVF